MAKVLIDESTLTDIADSIRSKKGTTKLIDPSNYAQEISGIESGGSSGSTFENGYTVNFHDADGVVVESHSAACGNKIYAPASYVAQYWTDSDGVSYRFPFTSNEVGKVYDLFGTGAGTCETMIYHVCGVSKEEYPFMFINAVNSSNPHVRAVFFKDYYVEGTTLYYGKNQETSEITGYVITNNVISNGEVTSTKFDALTVTKELVDSASITTTTNSTSGNYRTGSYPDYCQPYTNFDADVSIGRIDQTLYLEESELHPYALQEKTVTESGEVVPDDGYYGLSKVIVNIGGN